MKKKKRKKKKKKKEIKNYHARTRIPFVTRGARVVGRFQFFPPPHPARRLRDLFNFLGGISARVKRDCIVRRKHVPRTNRFRDTRINKTFNRIHRSSNFLEDRRSISRFTAFDKLLIVMWGTEAKKKKRKEKKLIQKGKKGGGGEENRENGGRGKKKSNTRNKRHRFPPRKIRQPNCL